MGTQQLGSPKTTSLSIKSEAASIQASLMAELRRVPGVHVYGGTAPLAAGVEKIPKQRNIIFNVDLEESDLKDLPFFKVPFDPERPLPFSSFDEICAALKPEDDKTQCIFNAKDVHAATTGMVAASIVKSVQSINKMRSLVEEGIAEKDWIAAIITNTFETGNPPKEGETDLDRGDFDVVKALVKIPGDGAWENSDRQDGRPGWTD